MKFTITTLALAAAAFQSAAALHVDFWVNANCQGGTRWRCSDQERNRCCAHPTSGAASLQFVNVDPNANWELRSYTDGGCARRTATSASGGRTSVCFVREPPYTGGGWGPLGRAMVKRDDEAGAAAEDCVRPDTLIFEDGTQIDVTSLGDVDYETLVQLAPETPADVPEQLHLLKV